MIKIFKCEKCGEAFDSEEECLEHEKNCNKELEEKIINMIGQYGIDVQHIVIRPNTNINIYLQAQITANIPSGYKINFTFEFIDEDDITEEFINNELRNFMGKAFEGKLNNMQEQYGCYDTYTVGLVDLGLLGRVFEGHNVKIEVLD